MTYHPDFADSTFSRVNLNSTNSRWKDVELVIQTGKAMDIQLYTIEIYQRGGSGLLTFDIGKAEEGVGDIKVQNWPLQNSKSFKAPLPGFDSTDHVEMIPKVDQDGTGYILTYDDPALYFPKPYAKIVKALIDANYGAAFVTWPECQRCWEIVTGTSPSVCLDPAPQNVQVYIPSFLCDKVAPDFCDQHVNVEDLYSRTFSCTSQHDLWYKDVDFYQDKCHHPSKLGAKNIVV
jgi:glucose-6-phosphate 1-dehydrogenase